MDFLSSMLPVCIRIDINHIMSIVNLYRCSLDILEHTSCSILMTLLQFLHELACDSVCMGYIRSYYSEVVKFIHQTTIFDSFNAICLYCTFDLELGESLQAYNPLYQFHPVSQLDISFTIKKYYPSGMLSQYPRNTLVFLYFLL